MHRLRFGTLLILVGLLGALGAIFYLSRSQPAPPDSTAPASTGEGSTPDSVELELPGQEAPTSDEREEVNGSEISLAPVPKAQEFLVRVIDGDGRNVEGAHVFLCDPDWRQDQEWSSPPNSKARTGADGTATFPAEHPERSLVIVAIQNHFPVLETRVDIGGQQIIELPTELSLDGWVKIDGAPAREGFALNVRGFLDVTGEWCPAARRALGELEFGESRLPSVTGAGGAFTIRGIPKGQLVNLSGLDGYPLRGAPEPKNELQVTTVATGVLLDLQRLPVLTGRPIQTNATPTGDHVNVQYVLHRPGGERKGNVSCAVGTPFAIPFHENDLTGAEIRLEKGWGFGGEQLAERIVQRALTESYDFGDIPIDEARGELVLHVTDLFGVETPGALAVAGGRMSKPTDSRGRTVVKLRPADETVTVGAYGFELQRVPVGPAAQGLEVTLVPANRLRLVVRSFDGAARLTGLQVALHLPSGLPQDAPESVSGFASVHGPTPSGAEWSEDYRIHYYPLDESGIFERCDLPADTHMTLEVLDRYGHDVLTEELKLARGEQREVQWTLPYLPRSVIGRVVDPLGGAVAGAGANMGGYFVDQTSDRFGYIRFDDVYTDDPKLDISAHGFASYSLAGPDVYRREVFQLEPARTVWVEVVGASGERQKAHVSITLEGGKVVTGSERSIGFYQFDGVPLRSGVALARTESGAEVETALGSSQVELRIDVRE